MDYTALQVEKEKEKEENLKDINTKWSLIDASNCHDSDKQKGKLNACKIPYKKTQVTERAEYIKTYSKLKHQEGFLEKITNGFITNMKIDSEFFQNIMHDLLELSVIRSKQLDALRTTAWIISNELKSAQSLINCPYDVQKIDITDCKQKLFKVSKMINEFHELSPLQSLLEEQIKLESELNEFESSLTDQRFCNDTSKKAFSPKKRIYKTYEEKIDRTNNEGVEDLNNLIARTGHSQGWSENDHLLFLKLRKKCNTIPAMVIAIQNKCPDLSKENIINHEAWYKIYLELREKQRNAVKEWRKRKSMEYEKGEEKVTTENAAKDKMLNNKKEVKPAMIRESKSHDSVKAAKTKELVKKWRIEKEEKSLMDEEQKRRSDLCKLMEAKRRKSRLERIKPLLLEYREQKLKQRADLKSDSSLENFNRNIGKYESIHMLKLFRQQDQEFIKKRLSHTIDSRKENQKNNEKRVPRGIIKPGESSTLFAPTKVWELKCRSQQSTEKIPQAVLHVKNIPKLAAAHWRNQETI